jgi:hypothetical protein
MRARVEFVRSKKMSLVYSGVLVCSQWIITLRVHLNAEDVSTEQQAGSVGSCL